MSFGASSIGAERSASVNNTARLQHSSAHAEALAAVHAVRNNPKAWKRLPKGFRHLRRAIFRAIIDHKNLSFSTQVGQKARYPFEGYWEPQCLVVRGDYDRKVRDRGTHRAGGSFHP